MPQAQPYVGPVNISYLSLQIKVTQQICWGDFTVHTDGGKPFQLYMHVISNC